MNIRAIIIDDEPNNVENLRQLLQKYCAEVEILGFSTKPRESIELIKILQPDLIFLDIEMPGLNGFELLNQLGEINSEIIFVTAYNSYAIKAIRFNALDYILKPIDIDELTEAVRKAELRLQDKNLREATRKSLINLRSSGVPQRIALSSSDRIDFFEINSIIRCRGENNYTRFFFDNGESSLVSKPLSEYEELLADHHFLRVHKSHLVNVSKIKSFIKRDGGYLKTTDGESVPVSRRKKDELIALLKTMKIIS